MTFFFYTAGRNVPWHYLETALTTYLHTCKATNWATRCAVLAAECLKDAGQYKQAALHLIRLTSEVLFFSSMAVTSSSI